MLKTYAVNLGKTKVMIFNTSMQWIRRSAPQLIYRGDPVEHVTSYVYLGITFRGPIFSMWGVADARLTQGYTALGSLERMCSQV